MQWDEPTVVPCEEFIQGLLSRADELPKFPMCFTHWDKNMINIMLMDSADISGVVNWKESYYMPLGRNIHFIARIGRVDFLNIDRSAIEG
jgi:hypothetical protein